MIDLAEHCWSTPKKLMIKKKQVYQWEGYNMMTYHFLLILFPARLTFNHIKKYR